MPDPLQEPREKGRQAVKSLRKTLAQRIVNLFDARDPETLSALVEVGIVNRDFREQGEGPFILDTPTLDVVERRPAGGRHPLLDLPNVIITPHIGGATRETLQRGAKMTASAVARLASGEIPDHLVNPEVLARKEVAP